MFFCIMKGVVSTAIKRLKRSFLWISLRAFGRSQDPKAPPYTYVRTDAFHLEVQGSAGLG